MKMHSIFMMSMIGWVGLSVSVFIVAGGDGDESPKITTSPGGLQRFLQSAVFGHSSHRNNASVSDSPSVRTASVSSSSGSSATLEERAIANFGSSSSKMASLARFMLRGKYPRTRPISTSSSSLDSHGGVTSSSSSSSSHSMSVVNFNQQGDSPETVLDTVKEVLACVMGAARDVFEHDGYASYDDTNGSNEVDGIIAVLDHVRDMLNSFRMRADPDFVTSYEETLRHNFASVGNFDPKNVYSYLSKKMYPDLDGHAGMDISQDSSEKIRALIATLKRDASDDKEQSLLRQMDYPFRNSATRQVFDAYVRGGKEAISVLQVTSKESAGRYEYLTNVTMQLKEDLWEAFKSHKLHQQISASHHAINDGHDDLADHAFSLTLDVETDIK